MTTFICLAAAAACLLGGILASLATFRRPRLCGWISVVAVGGASSFMLVAAARAFAGVVDAPVSVLPIPALGAALTLRVDALSALFLAITAGIAVVTTLYSVEYMRRYTRDRLAKYYPVLLLLFLSIGGTVVTTDLFWFLVFWEMMTLSSFFLVIFERESRDGHRAGWKYFFWNQGATLGLMAAALVLWLHSGSFGFDACRATFTDLLQSDPLTAHLLLALFVLGFSTKAGILPMGVWLPDAYLAAPSSATAAFGGTMTKLGIYGLLRVFLQFTPLGTATVSWGVVIATAGLVSMCLGTLYALKQSDAKRLMSYHVIGQVGYMFFGIGAGLALLRVDPILGTLGIVAGLFHLLNNALYKTSLFLGAGAIEFRTGTCSLAELPGGLGRAMAVTMGASLISSLAIAGVPPLNGFTSKWLRYATGILGARDSFVLPVAALIAMFVSLMTLASFLKYLGGAFLGVTASAPPVREVPWTMLAPQVVLAAACLVVGLLPMVPLRYVHQAIVTLPSGIGLPANEALVGAGSTLALATNGVLLASWAPLVVTFGLLALGAGVYYGLQTAGGATARDVPVWACGEEENPEWLRYRADSLYRPFKDALHIKPPRVRLPEVAVPGFLARVVDIDRWLYRPLVRGTEEAARGMSRTHVGIPQVYLLWIIVGAIAVLAIIELFASPAVASASSRLWARASRV
ncbi:MAG: hypothetical protein H3C62_13150, partial [Gemmatimonadaceae bacterium]|nr:hypothetical protein [Gemmatimonadaceae bacterium]